MILVVGIPCQPSPLGPGFSLIFKTLWGWTAWTPGTPHLLLVKEMAGKWVLGGVREGPPPSRAGGGSQKVWVGGQAGLKKKPAWGVPKGKRTNKRNALHQLPFRRWALKKN
jgi:hypothetical protein